MVIIFKEDWSEVSSFLFTCRGKNTRIMKDQDTKTERGREREGERERETAERERKVVGSNPEDSPSSLSYSLLPSHKYAESFSLRM